MPLLKRKVSHYLYFGDYNGKKATNSWLFEEGTGEKREDRDYDITLCGKRVDKDPLRKRGSTVKQPVCKECAEVL